VAEKPRKWITKKRVVAAALLLVFGCPWLYWTMKTDILEDPRLEDVEELFRIYRDTETLPDTVYSAANIVGYGIDLAGWDITTLMFSRAKAHHALIQIGPSAIPFLLRSCSAIELQLLGIDIWDFKKHMESSYSTMKIKSNAIMAISIEESIGLPTTSEIPALAENLQQENYQTRFFSIVALANITPPAKSALPALTKCLQDENEHVRAAAREAILKIDPQAASNLNIE